MILETIKVLVVHSWSLMNIKSVKASGSRREPPNYSTDTIGVKDTFISQNTRISALLTDLPVLHDVRACNTGKT